MDIDIIDPDDRVRLNDGAYLGTVPGDVYTVKRLDHGFVDIEAPSGRVLTVDPDDLYPA
jgi:hypothetical protein